MSVLTRFINKIFAGFARVFILIFLRRNEQILMSSDQRNLEETDIHDKEHEENNELVRKRRRRGARRSKGNVSKVSRSSNDIELAIESHGMPEVQQLEEEIANSDVENESVEKVNVFDDGEELNEEYQAQESIEQVSNNEGQEEKPSFPRRKKRKHKRNRQIEEEISSSEMLNKIYQEQKGIGQLSNDEEHGEDSWIFVRRKRKSKRNQQQDLVLESKKVDEKNQYPDKISSIIDGNENPEVQQEITYSDVANEDVQEADVLSDDQGLNEELQVQESTIEQVSNDELEEENSLFSRGESESEYSQQDLVLESEEVDEENKSSDEVSRVVDGNESPGIQQQIEEEATNDDENQGIVEVNVVLSNDEELHEEYKVHESVEQVPNCNLQEENSLLSRIASESKRSQQNFILESEEVDEENKYPSDEISRIVSSNKSPEVQQQIEQKIANSDVANEDVQEASVLSDDQELNENIQVQEHVVQESKIVSNVKESNIVNSSLLVGVSNYGKRDTCLELSVRPKIKQEKEHVGKPPVVVQALENNDVRFLQDGSDMLPVPCVINDYQHSSGVQNQAFLQEVSCVNPCRPIYYGEHQCMQLDGGQPVEMLSQKNVGIEKVSCRKIRRLQIFIPFRRMHFIHCCEMIRSVFFVKDCVLFANAEVLSHLLSIDQEKLPLNLFMFKLYVLMQYAVVFEIHPLFNNLAYNANHALNQSFINELLFKIVSILQSGVCIEEAFEGIKEEMMLHMRNSDTDNFRCYSGLFYKDVLDMCCNLTMAKVMGHPCNAALMNVLIVSCSTMLGGMYTRSQYMLNSSSTFKRNLNFRYVVNFQRESNGPDFGERCYNIFNSFLSCYFTRRRHLCCIGNNIYMSNDLILQNGEDIVEDIKRHVMQNTMRFDVLIDHMAKGCSQMIDRSSVKECMSDIHRYKERINGTVEIIQQSNSR